MTQAQTELHQEQCSACRGDSPPVTEREFAELKPQIPEWEVIEAEDAPKLQRTYEFSNFKAALAFTNAVGEAAESAGHHPSLLTEWGKVTVMWWTHAISGLHRNDFIMAAKCDRLAESGDC